MTEEFGRLQNIEWYGQLLSETTEHQSRQVLQARLDAELSTADPRTATIPADDGGPGPGGATQAPASEAQALSRLRKIIDDWRSQRLSPDEAVRAVGDVLGLGAVYAPIHADGSARGRNLTRYIDLIEFETDPVRQGRIQRLLIEEEDRFGGLAERMDQADLLIRRGVGRLRQQWALVARLEEDGADTATAVTVLATMTQTLHFMQQYRQSLLDGLDRSGI